MRDEAELATLTGGQDPKTVLFLAHHKGQIVKGCPATAETYLCCRYQVINQTLNCPLNCSYCILQFYLNQPATTIYTDFAAIFREFKQKIVLQPRRFFRIGTGELGDSLALPGSILFARQAVLFFARFSNVLFELKTKTANVEDLLDLQHNSHTVISWSLNPPEIVAAEEYLAAGIEDRLHAARRVQEAGYLLGFHFDPILIDRNSMALYTHLIRRLYQSVDPSRIAWISMGSLRFPPSTKEKIIERYPQSTIVYGEMIKGMDGKLRYARPVRSPFYRAIYNALKDVANPPFIYFCMESRDVWQDVTGFTPESNARLDFMFAESIHRRFPGLMPEVPSFADYESGFNLEDARPSANDA